MKLFMKRNRRVLVFTTVVMLFLVGVGVIQLVVNQCLRIKKNLNLNFQEEL